MNDPARINTGAALAPKQASVSQRIDSDLAAILDREHGMYQKLRDFEAFLFGMRDSDQGEPDATEPQSWEEKVRYKLDRISEIQQRQIESFDKISKFHI